MNEKLSRRKMLLISLLGAAFGLLAPTVVTVSDVGAQTPPASGPAPQTPPPAAPQTGTERRQERRKSRRQERREERRIGGERQ